MIGPAVLLDFMEIFAKRSTERFTGCPVVYC